MIRIFSRIVFSLSLFSISQLSFAQVSTSTLMDGTFPDVAFWRGQIWAAWQTDDTLWVRNVDTGHNRTYSLVPGSLAFARLGVANDVLYVVYRNFETVILRNLATETTQSLGRGYGNDPMAIGNGYVAWMDLGSSSALSRPLAGGTVRRVGPMLPTGISRVQPDGSIITIDQDRFVIPGYTRPCFADNFTVVEGVNTSVVVFRPNLPSFTIWDVIYSYTPRCASAGTRNVIATWGATVATGGGVRLATFSTAPSSTPNPQPNVIYKIRSAHSQKCLDIPGNSTSSGAYIQQYDCHGNQNQKWVLRSIGNGEFQIVSSLSGKCLDVKGASQGDGALLQQYTCANPATGNQSFRLSASGPSGYFRLQARHSGRCIDVQNFSTANKGLIQQWSCSGATNQAWRFEFP